MRIIVGISGASGVVMGYEMLKALRMQEDCEIHLVITQGARENFKYETDMDIREVTELADYCHDDKNMAASISSGSFRTDGMIVIPCSMKTVSAIANGYGAVSYTHLWGSAPYKHRSGITDGYKGSARFSSGRTVPPRQSL